MDLLFLQRGFGWQASDVAAMICANDAFKGLKKRFRRAVITSSLAYPNWDGGISAGNAEAVLAVPAQRTTTRFPLEKKKKKSNKTGKQTLT